MDINKRTSELLINKMLNAQNPNSKSSDFASKMDQRGVEFFAPLRSAQSRGPPDLVRRLALVCTKNFRSKRKYVFDSVRIGALFCMHMTAGPDFTGLGFVGGAAEQEASESRTVKRKEGPEVAEAREGRGSQNRE